MGIATSLLTALYSLAQLASAAGNKDAAYNIGTHFWKRSELKKALRFFKLAAERGNGEAAYNLGASSEACVQFHSETLSSDAC